MRRKLGSRRWKPRIAQSSQMRIRHHSMLKRREKLSREYIHRACGRAWMVVAFKKLNRANSPALAVVLASVGPGRRQVLQSFPALAHVVPAEGFLVTFTLHPCGYTPSRFRRSSVSPSRSCQPAHRERGRHTEWLRRHDSLHRATLRHDALGCSDARELRVYDSVQLYG